VNRSHSYEYPINAIIDVMFPSYSKVKCTEQEWNKKRDEAAHSFDNVPLTEATFELVLLELSDNERAAIHRYYRDGQTTKQIAEAFELSVSRAGQIIHEAWRALRRPSRLYKIQHGIEAYCKMKADEAYKKGLSEGHKNGYAEGYKAACELSTADAQKALEAAPDIALEDLDLSVRAYNCLKRGGFSTLKQLVNADPERVARVRNLGKKSYEEVIETLKKYNIDTKNYEAVLNNFSLVVNGKR
jgi:hypothetical protein